MPKDSKKQDTTKFYRFSWIFLMFSMRPSRQARPAVRLSSTTSNFSTFTFIFNYL